MKLERLELAYFRQYHEAAVDFPSGIVGIVGANGAGKSTLIEAINFALFGTKAIRGKLEELKTRNAPKRSTLSAALTFTHQSQTYRVERKATEAAIFIGGEDAAWCVGTREVSAAIESVLGMSYEEFSATYLTEQKGLEFLSGQKGAVDRERFIVRMMGYDKLERLQAHLRLERSEKKNLVKGIEAGLEAEEKLSARLHEEKKQVEQLTTSHRQAERVAKEREEEAAKLQKKFEEAEARRAVVVTLKGRLQEKQIRLEERSKRRRSFVVPEQKSVCATCGQPLNEELQLKAQTAYQASQKELAMLEEEIKQLEADRISIEQEIASYADIEDDFRRKKAAYETAYQTVSIARLQRLKIEGELNTARAHALRSEESLSNLSRRREEVSLLKNDLLLIEDGDLLLTDFRKYLNEELRPTLALLASEYCADLTDGRYSLVEIAPDFTPSVVDDGERKSVISGGEEDILNLCVRLALSTMLAERAGHTLSLLILDEVFGSLDLGRRSNVLLLLEKLKNRFEQILVITHLDDVKDAMDVTFDIAFDDIEGESSVFENSISLP
jgi:DNA repair exonuclease SbcCD ATPase subunit